MRKYPEAPEHLTERSKALWRELGPTRVCEPEKRVLFAAALEALDRADQARREVEQRGLLLTTQRSGVAHANPAAKIERESREQFAKIWRALDLHQAVEDVKWL